MKIDKDDNRRVVIDRSIKLFSDWLSTKKISEIKEIKKFIQNRSNPIVFNDLVRKMGRDGRTLSEIFQKDWTLLGQTVSKAKNNLIGKMFRSREVKNILNEETGDGTVVTSIGTSYYPVSDRSNAMISVVDENDRDTIIQIRHAITGGNMTIARELIKNSWGTLSLKERNGLVEWVNAIGAYNIEVEGFEDSAVPKGRQMIMKKLEKRSEVRKDDFSDKLLMTAISNMKIS